MSETFHATTIVSVRRDGKVVIGGDGQVTLGNTVVKANARKVRRLGAGNVLAGFAGATADAFTLFELFEAKLEKHGTISRAPRWNWPRTGAPIGAWAGSKQCSPSRTRKPVC